MFFQVPKTCFHTRSCTSHFVHFKQSFVPTCMLTCTSPCTYYKDQVNVRSIPLTINPEPRLYFIEKEITDRSLVYLEPNNQTTFCQLCLKAISMIGHSQCLLVLESKAVSKHFKRDIKTM